MCEEYKDIFSEHKGDVGHTKLLTVDIDTYHPRTVQKPYTLPQKDIWWVWKEPEMLEKVEFI